MFINTSFRRFLLLSGFCSTYFLMCMVILMPPNQKTMKYNVYEYNNNPNLDEIYFPGGRYSPFFCPYLDYVKKEHPKPSKKSYCTFNHRLPKDIKLSKKYIRLGPEQGIRSPYRVLYNVIEGKVESDMPDISYATHVTAEYVNYLPEILRTWEGPVSIAAFVPDLDIAFVLEQINQYCYCIPAMSRVSLHLVYPRQLVPSTKDVYFTRPDSCKVVDSKEIKTHRYFDEEVIYPANVCRNVARNGVRTTFVLVSDVEFIPSEGLATRFTNMIKSDFRLKKLLRRVFVVPIFEVGVAETIPSKKSDLVKLIKQNKATYFRSKLCNHCHEIPGMEKWIETDPKNRIEIFKRVSRERPYHKWTPVFISSKAAPYYHELLSWEGLQNRDPQLLELCLKGYQFNILDGAFLTHWPQDSNKSDSGEWRTRFVQENSKQFLKIITSFSKSYKHNTKCMLDEAANHLELNIFNL